MVVSESGAQASRAGKTVQGGWHGWLRGGLLAAATGLLAGCSSTSAMNPVNWWHKQEGGKIAQDRPAPPGADQPYPNIATVPPKPEPPDAEAMKKLTDSLIADRTNAQHLAESAPLADPSSPTASPSLFGVGTAPPPPPPGAPTAPAPAPGGGTASASIPAVTAPAQPPAPAPRRQVQSAPLAAPPTPEAATPPAPAAKAQPTLPAEPPPRPGIAGAPPPPPATPTPMPAAAGGPTASVVFPDGASSLSAPAAEEVKAFAAKRGSGVIVVTGYGDTPASDPAAQSAALTLALSRAQAVADSLKADGVPPEALRVNAEASGRGVSLRLLQ